MAANQKTATASTATEPAVQTINSLMREAEWRKEVEGIWTRLTKDGTVEIRRGDVQGVYSGFELRGYSPLRSTPSKHLAAT